MRTSKLCHFFLACALFLPSCNRQQLGPGGGYVLIGDRSDAARERIYIIHEDMVFVADHIFPGYQDRKYYTSTLDDMSVLSEIEIFDDLSAPFAPGDQQDIAVLLMQRASLKGSCTLMRSMAQRFHYLTELKTRHLKIELKYKRFQLGFKRSPS